MVFDASSAPHLKPWLIRTLEPICDAEPGALAEYILALLKHNGPEAEMRKELSDQLEEFLEKETMPFIDTLFTVLRTKSYLPYNTATGSPKTQDNGIPIPLDAFVSSDSQSSRRKRTLSDDERDGRPPTKGPRLNHDGQFSRFANGNMTSGNWNRGQGGPGFGEGFYGGAQMGGMNQMGGMTQMAGMNTMGGMNQMGFNRRGQGYQPPDQRRGLCRDYFNSGYCSRGATCKYSHSDDALLPGQLYPMGPPGPGMGLPFMPIFPGNPQGMPFMMGGGPGGTYDPNEARMDMRSRSNQRAPLLSRAQQEDGNLPPGELPVIQDLTPAVPHEGASTEALPGNDVEMPSTGAPAPIPVQMSHSGMMYPSMDMGFPYPPPIPSGDAEMNGMPQQQQQQQQQHQPPPHQHQQPQHSGRGNFRGGPRGRGRGTFGGEAHSFRPEKRSDKTLVVEKIPEDKLSLEKVNEWFKRFGTVTNVAIDPSGAKALVSFSNHEEAHTAWRSEDAVFGNRFVKVFWHRPMEGHGQVGQRMLAASAPVVANIGTGIKPTPPPSTPSTPVGAIASSSTSLSASAISRKPSSNGAGPSSSTLSALAAKQKSLEEKISEQKTLMGSLETASTTEEKKEILGKLRKLNEEVKGLSSSVAEETASATAAAAKKPAAVTDHEKKEKERLDKELEGQGEENAEDLQAKLEKLKAEAASLGLDAALPANGAPAYRGGFRGRARGASRSYYRGAVMRGGPPRGSMKLDNRPKKLLVKGVSEEHSQALKDWYETTAQLESVEPAEGGAYLVSFRTRAAAEQGLAKGSNIPLVGSVQITWSTGKDAPSNGVTSAPPSQPTTTKPITKVVNGESSSSIGSGSGGRGHETPEVHHAALQEEEEVVASGWGVDGDDGDGMGML